MAFDPTKIDWKNVPVLGEGQPMAPAGQQQSPAPRRSARSVSGAAAGQRMMNDLMQDFGLSKEQAAGVAGNFDHESGGFRVLQEAKPMIPGSRGGFGYAQWTGPRRRNFERFVAANNLDPMSYEANYGFFKYEVMNDPHERAQFSKVLNARTVDEATRIVSDSYLRPGIPHMNSRLQRAQAYYNGDISAAEAGNPGIDMSSVDWGQVPIVAADGSITEPAAPVPVNQQEQGEGEADPVAQQFEQLETEAPGRYQVIPADQYDAWKANWDQENQSTGIAGDTARLLSAGWAGVGLGVREAVKAIPGIGKPITGALDTVDEWLNGQKSEEYLGGKIDKAVATMTPATRAARGKQWWDGERNRPGAAWADPRSYYSGIVESLPSMAVTMGPSMALARGAYVTAIAGGASQKVAAAAAARTALVAGAVSEGIIGGGQAAVSVREQIAQMPRQALEESAAVQRLMQEGGLSIDEAIEAISDDAATQAFLIGGVATGVFGGFGDRVLAKIVADGVGGNLAQRIVQGTVREGVAEGVLEEAPQEAGAQVAENIALRNTVDPDRDLTEGVANAAAGGLAVGGAMGAGMGAVGGAMSPRSPQEPETEDRTPRAGVLVEAEKHNQRKQAEASGSAFFINDPAIGDLPPGDLHGVKVTMAPDQTGVKDGASRIILPDGNTHVIGSRLLIPERIEPAPVDPEGAVPADQEVPAGAAPATPAGAADAAPEGAPAVGTDVRIPLPDGAEIMARVEGYADGEAIVMDVGTGEILQVPVDEIALSPAAAADVETVRKADPGQTGEPLPEELPGSEPIAQETSAGETLPVGDTVSVLDAPARAPGPGQRVIVDSEGVDRFPGTIQSYEDGAEEALVRRDDGSEVQVPVADLKVSKLTDDQVEQRERAENPPVERETITSSEPTAREVTGKQAVLPDEKHARLFDLGKLRRDSKRTIGASTLDMDLVSPGEQSRLADEFGVSPASVGQIADDYRFRVERAARQANSRTPFKMPPVNGKLIERMKSDDKRNAAKAARQVDDDAPSATPDSEANAVPATVPADPAPSVDQSSHEAATSPENDRPEPTQAQKEAGNYKLGHVRLSGFDISIENPKGSTRSGTDRGGKKWSITMKSHYGYFKGTVGKDKDHIDTFIRPGTEQIQDDDPVFVIDQVDPETKEFDEHKVMLGYKTRQQAQRAYKANYARGWKGLGTIVQTNAKELKNWFDSGDTRKPFTERDGATAESESDREERKKAQIEKNVAEGKARIEARKQKLTSYTPEPGEVVTGYSDSWNHLDAEKNGIRYRRFIERLDVRSYGEGTDTKIIGDTKRAAHMAPASVIWAKTPEGKVVGAVYTAGTGGPLDDTDQTFDTYDDMMRAFVAKELPVAIARASQQDDLNRPSAPQFAAAKRVMKAERKRLGLTGLPAETYPNDGKSPAGLLAREYVLKEGKKTGTEHLVALGPYGETLSHTNGQKSNVPVTRELSDTFGDEKSDIAIHHNHPRSNSLSLQDIAHLAFPGISHLWAHAHNGDWHYARGTQALRDLFPGSGAPGQYAIDLTKVFKRLNVLPLFSEHIQREVTAQEISVDEASQLHQLALMVALHRAGVIEFATSADMSRIEYKELQDGIEEHAKRMARDIFGPDAPVKPRYDRPAIPLRHPGNVGIVQEGDAGASGRVADPEADAPGSKQGSGTPQQAVKAEKVEWPAEYDDLLTRRLRPDEGESQKDFHLSLLSNGTLKHYADVYGVPVEGKSREAVWDQMYAKGARVRGGGGIVSNDLTAEQVPDLLRNEFNVGSGDPIVVPASLFKEFVEALRSNPESIGVDNGWRISVTTPLSGETARLEMANYGPDGVRISRYSTITGGGSRAIISGTAKKSDVTRFLRAFIAANPAEKADTSTAKADLAPAPAPAAPPEAAKTQFAGNKLFTEDKVEAARRRLRAKLNQVNTGVDPEVLVDGMTIAGAYIEAGVRKFSEYAAAMVADLGPNVRPYLLSFYEGARNYPGLEVQGMDSVSSAKKTFDALMADPATTTTKEKSDDVVSGSPRNVQDSVEGQQPDQVQDDGESRGTLDLFGQSDRAVERKPVRSKKSGDRADQDRGQPDVPGEPATSAAGSEQQVPERRGNRDGTSHRADRGARRASRDYRIADGELTRKGSWRDTAERNVQIVELVKQLESEGREATADERALMVQYTGWGASEVANGIFPTRAGVYKDDRWKALGERLKAALSDADYKTAARSTQYAHYTSESVIRSIYDGLARIGFSGGRVLEPGMGTGHFRGIMPANIAGASSYTGIEFDGTTAAIAKHLYPDSRVQHGDYTETKLPKGYFDLAIGNPPFAQTKVTNDPEYRKYGFALHDYFFAKTIDRVKPGGVMVFVTSRYTMDKVRDTGRRYLADRANLLGAIRLPQTAFQANAGTEVVTDVLFLQKRGPGIEDNGISWTDTKEITVGENTFTVNEYIADHPDMVLGSHSSTGSMYRANEYTVAPDKSRDIEESFAQAVKRLPEQVYRPDRGSEAEQAKVIEKDFDPKAKKEGALYVSDKGDLMIRQDGVGQPFTERLTSTGKMKPLSKRETAFLKDFVALRDAVKQTQYDQLTDGDWQKSLDASRKVYREAVERNGRFLEYTLIERTDKNGNVQAHKRFKYEPLFMIDPDGPLAFTVEKITESGEIIEGAIFRDRVLNKPAEPEIVTTQDAMFVSLDKIGRFDLADVAKRAGRTESEVISDLGTSIYEDPGKGWVLADEYLSGNVVQKLAEARAAAELDPKYAPNVDALIAVQPRPLGASEIDVKLGASWLPTSDIEAFAKEVLEQDVNIGHNLKVGTWLVDGSSATIGPFAMENHSPAEILSKVLNNSQLRVTRPVIDANGKRGTEADPEATEKLNDIARKMKDRFRTWIWSDPDRAKRLTNYYNDNFNNIAPRQFDGSHLTLPGTSLKFDLYPHQKRTIWRAIQTGDTYLAHAVGAGKTFEMIAIGMEERRLGLSRKPLYVVPNHMLGQFSREFLELYPAANIMVADEKNFHTKNRRKFIAQAALNDPDAIILTHAAFGRVGLSDETNDAMIQTMIDEWKDAQDEIEKAEGKTLTVKKMQSQIERLEKRLKGQQERETKDAVMTFEELGADRILVDEIHEFRKLDFVTNQGNIKGIVPQGSKQAWDLFAKISYLRGASRDPKRVIVGASGTPITNTMGELYTVQRMFQPDILEDIGAHNFDAWASMFGEVVEGLEQNPAGQFETVGRFAKFQNVPELMRRVRSFMDILTSSSLGELVQRPTRVNPPREIRTTPSPDGYKEYQGKLKDRITAIRNRGGRAKKGDDIIPSVISDGRFSAIDMRFVDPARSPDPNSKLNKMLDDVIADYKATAGASYNGVTGEPDPLKGSTLVVFSDIGLGDRSVQSRGFDMKAWIEKRLLDAGIPAEHVAFIRDHKSHAKKERLFADLREGKKRILIGGKDMETGVNVQKRLTHLYHLDAPWFPASIEQREGRGDRQGNQNPEIVIRAYASKGSYDSTMWSMNARKARFIEQALNGDETVRKMEDVSEASSFEMAAALSSGDPRYLQLAGLRQEVERLGRLRKAHFDDQNRYKRREHSEETLQAKWKRNVEEYETAIKRGHRIEAGAFSARVGKGTFDKRDEWSKALYADFSAKALERTDGTIKIGEIGGHDVNYYGVTFEDGSHKASLAVDLPGDMPDLAEFPSADEITVGGIGQRAVNQVNSLENTVADIKRAIENSERTLKQVRSQIGAPFPEEPIYLEKQSELSDLEAELQSDAAANDETEADKAGSAKDVLSARPQDGEETKLSRKRGAKALQNWFGKSKVVDEDGNPLVVYHGTDQVFEQFDPKSPKTVGGIDLRAAGITANFFTSSRVVAEQFAAGAGSLEGDTETVISAYLKIERPYVIHANGQPWIDFEEEITEALQFENHDGVIIYRVEDGFDGAEVSDVFIVKDARQIKSTDNNGAFDPDDPRFRYSRQSTTPRPGADLRTEIEAGPVGALAAKLIESGKVRIVEKRPDAIPEGAQAWTAPDGTITLLAPAIDAGEGTAVLLHEALHAGHGALAEKGVWKALNDRLQALYRQHERSTGGAKAFFDAARARAQSAGVSDTLAPEEFAAYAVEEYEAAPKTLKRWVDDVLGAVRAWTLRRFGRRLGRIDPPLLRALAVAALRDQAAATVPAPASRRAASRNLMFSKKMGRAEVRDQVAGRWTDLSPKLLSLVPLNYFDEMKRPRMSGITKYLRIKRAMDTYRSEKHEVMDKVAQSWRKFASRNRKAAADLASLMHDSTRMGVDPAAEYEDGPPPGFIELKERFDALPPIARNLYRTVRDGYVRTQNEIDRLIMANVQKAQVLNEKEAKKRYDEAKRKLDQDHRLTDFERKEKSEALTAKYKADTKKSRWAAKARLTKLRQTFEQNRVPEPYFPLARFGDYFVSVRDMAGDVISFSRFESDADRRRWMRENKAAIENEYPGVIFEQGVLGNSADVRSSMDPRIVAEIDGILRDANVDAEVMDAIYQKWLQSMPDLSIRKRYIHRKGTTGFHKDALRAFASHMFHAGHQMGKLKYGIDLQEAVDDSKEQARTSDDPTRAGQLVNELSKRHEWVMNPKGSKIAQKINSAAFIWYLAATPAAAMINMSQPILVGIPVLGARLGGVAKASAAMLKASADVVYGKGDIAAGRLDPDEKRAIAELYATGSIDRTMAMEIAGIGDSGVAYSPLRHEVMRKISWMFHRAEVVNREVTALAAYRMAREKGMTHEKAVDAAHELNFTVNYDYSNSSRPRILQSDFAKIAGVFMSYQLNVWYRIFRDIHQSFAGDSAQARKEARYQLGGLMAMQTLLGGTSGFFMYNALMALAGLFFDDEDDPFSFKHEAERGIYDLFGDQVGGMIINGIPGHLAGVDLTSRVGMADFFLRMPEASKEGRDWWMEFVAGSLGASVGAVGNAVVGAHYISEGDTARGVELMVPKAIKDLMKAGRYANEGLLTRKGDIILPRDELSAWDVVVQASGFSPAKVSTAHKLRGRKYGAQQKITSERSELINRFATAVRNKDPEGRKRAIKQIQAWNKRSYAKTLPITKETLERSMKTRARIAARRQDGFLPVNERVGHYLEKLSPKNPYR